MSKVYGCGIFMYRIYEEFHINYDYYFIYIYIYIYIYIFQIVYKKTYIQNLYNVTGRKIQPQLKWHYKFISTKNSIFTSLDDIHASSRSDFSKDGLQCIKKEWLEENPSIFIIYRKPYLRISSKEVCMPSEEVKIIFFVKINLLWNFNRCWVFLPVRL